MKYSGDNALHVVDFFDSLMYLRKRYSRSEISSRELVVSTLEHFASIARANKIDSVLLSKERYWQRANKGICTYCGKNQAVPGRRLCATCLRHRMLEQRSRRAKPSAGGGQFAGYHTLRERSVTVRGERTLHLPVAQERY